LIWKYAKGSGGRFSTSILRRMDLIREMMDFSIPGGDEFLRSVGVLEPVSARPRFVWISSTEVVANPKSKIPVGQK
jgi:hypothetical protein